MIKRDECIRVGRITKPHGTKGSLLLLLKNIQAEEIKKRDTAFVEMDGLLVPFFIEQFQNQTSEVVLIQFEGINSETKARTFAGYPVYFLHGQIKRKKRTITLKPVKGYTVHDQITGFTGTAGDIEDYNNNPLLQVISDGKEYLIPLHEEIIREINDKDKIILIQAPEGLFDL